MAPCKSSWHLLNLNPRFLPTRTVRAILRTKFFNQTSLEPRGQKAHSIPASTTVGLCHGGTRPITPQGRPTSGSPDTDWTLQDTVWPRALSLLMPGPPPGNTKISSSHCRSHCDICGLGKAGGAQFSQSQQHLQGEFCQDMRNQQGGSDPCSPATCPSHGDLWQPDCPDTASPTKAPTPSGTYCNIVNPDTAQFNHTQLQATNQTPRPALRNRVSAAPA